MLDPAPIHAALRSIPDPEMPISIVDLGLVREVRVVQPACDETSHEGRVEIDLLPTFIGCPALDMIANEVRAKVGALPGVAAVKVNWLFDPPWTVDRITDEGRASLKAHGVTVPERARASELEGACSTRALLNPHPGSLPLTTKGAGARTGAAEHLTAVARTVTLRTSAVPCPFCNSTATYLDSPFGPTRCRSIYYCEACRNSFEHMKRVEPHSA